MPHNQLFKKEKFFILFPFLTLFQARELGDVNKKVFRDLVTLSYRHNDCIIRQLN